MKQAVLKPRVSEKSYALSESGNTYVFDVLKELNKHDVAQTVAKQYGVTVISARLANVSGKPKRSIKARGRSQRAFSRSDIRKAYVTLKEGDKLPIFNSVADDSDKEAK